MTVKRRNPQDATRRNVQARNKQLARLTARVRALEQFVREVQRERRLR